jgi:lactate permease
MVWTQNYDPCHNILTSTLLAALPIVLLLGLLATGRVPAALAALAGLFAAVAAAVFVFTPAQATAPDGPGLVVWAGTVLSAAGYEAAFGLFPIGWIVLAAIFLYTLTVDTGRFEVVKHSVLALSPDRRIQALLIAFCFGAPVDLGHPLSRLRPLPRPDRLWKRRVLHPVGVDDTSAELWQRRVAA